MKPALVASFNHLPDSRGTQITAYICMQLASKSPSLIACILDTNSQSISLSFGVLKMRKIQREKFWKDQYCTYFISNFLSHIQAITQNLQQPLMLLKTSPFLIQENLP